MDTCHLVQILVLLTFLVSTLCVPVEVPIPFEDKDRWTISWSDDFRGDSGARFNGDKWEYQTPEKNENGEIQHYQDSVENARLTGKGTGLILPCMI